MKQTKHPLRGLAVRRKDLEEMARPARKAQRHVVHIEDTRRAELPRQREAALAFLRSPK